MRCASLPDQDCELASLGEFIDRSGLIGQVTVLKCRRCGHGITLPEIEDVGFLYEGRESQDFQPNTNAVSSLIKSIAFRLSARKLVRQAGINSGSLLDFGCGSGMFTNELAKVIPAQCVVASDFFSEPPQSEALYSYISFADLELKQEQFDTVIAMHVLEHANDPGKLLERLVGHVRPGGTLVVEVPNIECRWARIFGRFWDGWYVPFHRQHFSVKSLKFWAEQAGLQPYAAYGVCVPTMGRTFRNLANGRSELVWLIAGILAHPLQLLGETLTREASAIRLILKKPA